MGGGGGSSGWEQFDPAIDIDELRRQAQEASHGALLAADVNALLNDLLAEINDRDVETTNRYLDELVAAIGDELAEFDRLLFGGSVAKHTYVDGLSDIDALAVFHSDMSAESPQSVLQRLVDVIRRKAPQGEIVDISHGNLAVTVTYRDGNKIQLLPATRSGDSLVIPGEDGVSWRSIEPRKFARALTEANQRVGGAMHPAIKLAKSITQNFPEDRRLSGYHLEALAIAAFQGYDHGRNPKEAVTHLFRRAAQDVLRPIVDVTGQSRHLDEYLGGPGSDRRRAVAHALARVARAMESASTVEHWKNILDV